MLSRPYDFEKGRLIVREMTELLVLELVDKELVCDQMELTVGYDIANMAKGGTYSGPVTADFYGREVPKHAHGTENLSRPGSSTKRIVEAVMALYERVVDPALLIRRVYVVANNVVPESSVPADAPAEQLDLFTDYAVEQKKRCEEAAALEKEKRMQRAMLKIQKKYGKNAILKGTNLEDGATTIARNGQIGGHKA